MTAAKLWTAIFLAVAVLEVPLGITGAPQDGLNREPPRRVCSKGRLYFNETGKCYHSDSRGPCIETMTIQPISKENKLQAKCDCEKYGNCYPRPNVFWREYNRCYLLFDQGPCPNDQWVSVNDNREPICEAIPCLEQYNAQPRPFEDGRKIPSNKFLFPRNNTCFVDRQPADFCVNKRQVAIFHRDSLKPICSGWSCSRTATIVGSSTCDQGFASDEFGGCEPTVEI